jgi:DNA repair exonuclease SbcCD ATPase subunit
VEQLIDNFIKRVNYIENFQRSQQITKERLETQLKQMQDESNDCAEKLDICMNAIGILTTLSDSTVRKSCDFITDSINSALEKIFTNSRKRIKITEGIRGNTPQLEMELYENDDTTPLSLRDDSGHGVSQIISLLCSLCLIAITGKRRLFIMDEITSGLSSKAREIVSEIMNEFTTIGFQFIVSEHGFIPKGSKVYVLESNGNTSKIVDEYIEESGIYLNDGLKQNLNSGLAETAIANTSLDGNIFAV